MKLEFKINEYYLVGYTMASKHKPFPAWKNLEEKIWQKYKDEPAYYFLNPKYIGLTLERILTSFDDKNIDRVFRKHSLKLKEIYKEIFKTKEFKRLLKETKGHLIFVENQWKKNEKEALKNLRKISGLPIPKHKIIVYITHPKSRNAKTIDKRTIACGRTENWKNYLTVYLCHELLHIMTWPGHFQPDFDILHAIMILIDDELKFRLNKKGKYLNFRKEELSVKALKLIAIAKKILPYWKKYSTGDLGKNILELERFLIQNRNKIGLPIEKTGQPKWESSHFTANPGTSIRSADSINR